MNGWRWLGMMLFLVALASLGVSVYGQDKDKKDTKEPVKEAPKEAPKPAVKEPPKEEPKEAVKEAVKEAPKEAPQGSGEKLALTAFEGKEPFYQEMTTHTTQNMTVQQQKVVQDQKQTFWFSWTPKEKKDGKYNVVQKILGVKMDIEIGGNKISFDSTAKDIAKNPMSEFFKTLIGQEFTLVISPDKEGRLVVEEVGGVKNLVDKLSSVNQAMMPLLKQILTDEAIKHMAEPMLGVIPPHGEVPKDKTWTGTSRLDMGPIGTYTTKNKYTYEGPDKDKRLVTIKVATELTYAPPMGGAEKSNLPFRILGANLTSKEAGGTILFNTEKGRIESAEMNAKLEGNLKIEIANMQTEVDLNQSQVTKLKSMDKNPIPSQK